MEVFDYKGICLKRDKRAIYLDPSSGRPDGAVSHGHSDHLRPKTHMTEPTKEVMIARTRSKEATTHKFHEKFKLKHSPEIVGKEWFKLSDQEIYQFLTWMKESNKINAEKIESLKNLLND